MRTAYIQRTTEDPDEDMEKVKGDVDIFIGLEEKGGKVGLEQLTDFLLQRS